MNHPVRVLLMAWNFPPAVGGIETVARHLADGLPGCGLDVFTIARHAPEGSDDPVIRRPERPGLAAYQLFAWREAWRRLRAVGAEVIVCAGIVNAPVAWCLSRWFSIPYVLLAHGSDVAHGGWWYRRVMGFLFRQAAGVPANSHPTRYLLEGIGCRPERIRVIHPGVDVERFQELGDAELQAWRLRHQVRGRRVLLTTGRLIRRKGILEFIEQVLPALVRRYPDLIYVVAGGDATASLVHAERLLETIGRRVGQLGLQDSVRLLGHVPDDTLREWYYLADLFVLPAIPVPGDVEGFGIVFLEAALARTPAVATRLGGIPDAVEPGQSGVLVNPGDPEALTRAIVELLDDPGRLVALGGSARQRVLDRFAWPAIVRSYADFIGEVVARSREGGRVG